MKQNKKAESDSGHAVKAKSNLIKNKASVEVWSVPLKEIYQNDGVRLDASHYDRETTAILKQLSRSGFPLKPLSELAKIFLPGQFVRIWAEEQKYGYPYVNATDLMGLMGIGSQDETPRFLSRETDTDIDELIIREGWLLMTCSGTIGRVFYVPKRIDGWVGTHDMIRIVPKPGVLVGFLHAYLSSPMAQKQIVGHMHGGQIDHVTDDQIGGVLVPMIPDDEMKKIHKKTMSALKLREEAISELTETSDLVQAVIKNKAAAKNE